MSIAPIGASPGCASGASIVLAITLIAWDVMWVPRRLAALLACHAGAQQNGHGAVGVTGPAVDIPRARFSAIGRIVGHDSSMGMSRWRPLR